MPLTIRRAGPDDAGAAADLWLRARKAALDAIPAPVHTGAADFSLGSCKTLL
jgi:hypothetical protein